MMTHALDCDMDEDCTCAPSEPFFCDYEGPGPHECRGSAWEHEQESISTDELSEKELRAYVNTILGNSHETAVMARTLSDAEASGDEERIILAQNAALRLLSVPLDWTEQGIDWRASAVLDAFIARAGSPDESSGGVADSLK